MEKRVLEAHIPAEEGQDVDGQNSEGAFGFMEKATRIAQNRRFYHAVRCCKRSYALIRVCYDDDHDIKGT